MQRSHKNKRQPHCCWSLAKTSFTVLCPPTSWKWLLLFIYFLVSSVLLEVWHCFGTKIIKFEAINSSTYLTVKAIHVTLSAGWWTACLISPSLNMMMLFGLRVAVKNNWLASRGGPQCEGSGHINTGLIATVLLNWVFMRYCQLIKCLAVLHDRSQFPMTQE